MKTTILKTLKVYDKLRGRQVFSDSIKMKGDKKKEKNQHFNNCTRMGKGYELSIYGEEKLKGQSP